MRFELENTAKHSLTRWGTLGLVIIASIFIGVFINQHKANIQKTQAATQTISSLYLDDEQDFLSPDITEEMIAEAYEQVSEVNGLQNKYLRELIDDVETKYQAMEDVNSLFETDQPLFEDGKINPNRTLNEDVEAADITKLRKKIPAKKDDFYTALEHEYDHINKMFSHLSAISDSIESFPSSMSMATLQRDIRSFKELEAELAEVRQHPQSSGAVAALQQKGESYVNQLISYAEEIKKDSQIVEELFSSESLAELLTGSEIDPRPLVAVTFDDGPCENTLEILKILKEYQVQATFFQLGKYVELYPEITEKVHQAGHEIGNHSYSHANFDNLTAQEIIDEINTTQTLITEITGEEPTQYRTPYGNGRRQMMSLYPELYPVYWNVDSEDWVHQNEDMTVAHTLESLQHRSIILMHDSQPSTTAAIKTLIPELIDRGYVFVSPDQIPEADNYRL